MTSIVQTTYNGEISKGGGRMFCGHCYSQMGFKVIRRYPNIYFTCVGCGAKEKHNNITGEVLSQTIPQMLVDKFKASFDITL
jgi:RNase P subunit RPR2